MPAVTPRIASWILLGWLLVVPSGARADIAPLPEALWGSPGPRTVEGPERRRPVPVLSRGQRAPRPDAPPERDRRIDKRSERVELVFLPNLVWVRSRLVVRSVDRPARSVAMGIAEHAYRTHGLPLHFLEVRVDGEPTPIFERTLPYPPRAAADEVVRPGWDAWLEWRVDLRPDRDTVVEISYLRPAEWRCDDGVVACPPEAAGPFVAPFPYARQEAARYRDGVGRLELVVRSSGLDASFERAAPGADLPPPSARAPLRRVPIEAGEAVVLGPADADTIEVFARVDSLPRTATPHEAFVPGWLALLDRSLFAAPFEPRLTRLHAPGYDADGFAAHVEELQRLAQGGNGREAEVARGLLAALRTRLLATVRWQSETWDDEDGPLPAPEEVGWLGGRLDEAEWAGAVEDAAAWLTPPGEEPPTVDIDREVDLIDKRHGKRSTAEGREAAVAQERAAALLEQLVDERYQRPTSGGVRERDDAASARALGLELGPPFGRPNQLVLAHRGGQRALELPVVVGTLLVFGLVAWVWRRRRAA